MRKNGRFARVFTAMVTPFAPDMSVDLDVARALAKRLVETGSDGIVVAGSTGEAATLTHQEKLDLFRAVVDEVGGKALVIAGTGTNDTRVTIELTAEAEAIGVDGAMIVAPYYNKPPQAGLYRHFSQVAKATKLPLMVYNVPGRTASNISADTMIALARDFANIVALKEASGNLEQVAEIREKTPKGFAVYSGDDNMTIPIMSIGGEGVVSVASHVAGMEIQDMIASFIAGNVMRAAELHRRLLPLFRVIFVTSNPIPIKAALKLIGCDVGGLRSPLVEAADGERAQVRSVLESLSLLGA
ncbi:MAG: 4-hydroxy-tetrahydrodipicolinate synthase [Clostridia bacterium]|nr:4-hydroxy-tetrahydrodipicolinate synthase [Clostridia bacterium]